MILRFIKKIFLYKKARHQILGMNSRNLDFIRPFNLKKAKEIADNKLLSKKILRENGLAVPNLIGRIRSREELENFNWQSLPEGFALKPNRGFGGEGILVVYGKKKDLDNVWIKADGSLITVNSLKNHINNILDGSFSLSGTPDIAFFEERLKLLKLFKSYCYKGIPDIRIIVFNKVPTMAMLRLPTKLSNGKANLQQGAIGVGIDMASGITTTALWGKKKIIEYIPETRLLLSGIKIPCWNDILSLAIRAQEISNMGFLGADIAIDENNGPMIIELNARPGLSIQIANLSGLKERLKKVSGLKIKTVSRGIRVGADLFGGEIEEELEEISGKKVISTVEKVKLIGKDGKEIEVEAKIDTGAYSSSLDIELANKLGYKTEIEKFQKFDFSCYEIKPENEQKIKNFFEKQYKSNLSDIKNIAVIFSASGSSIRPVIKINFEMNKELIISKINIINRKSLKYPLIIGKRDLKKFLIDVNK